MRKKIFGSKWTQLLLFILTVFTTTCAGASHLNIHEAARFDLEDPNLAFDIDFLLSGLTFSFAFLGVLTVHEFGHYIVAKYHKVKTTLPYYIPFFPPLGTMGAVIQQKQKAKSKKQMFDIGVAGPLAGFVAAIILLVYGFQNLPPADKIYDIHPDYVQGEEYQEKVYQELQAKEEQSGGISIAVGTSLLFEFFKEYVANAPENVPNKFELMHYPLIFAGFLSLLFTAINLLPIGQLDGGHVLYGLIGYERFKKITPYVYGAFVFYAGLGSSYLPSVKGSFSDFAINSLVCIGFLLLLFEKMFPRKELRKAIILSLLFFVVLLAFSVYLPNVKGYEGWIVYCVLLVRFMGIQHPKAEIEKPLSNTRKVIGWIALLIFILCFSPQPLVPY